MSRRDLTPFFDQVYRGSAVFDYGVESVSSEETDDELFLSDVVVRRHGDGIFPVTILVTLANGEQRRFAWDGGGRWHRVRIEHASRAVSAQIDPDQVLLLDTNFTNNSFTTEPQAGRAATKWAANMDGVAAGSAAHLGVLRVMTSTHALRDGIRRVNRAPVVLACVFAVTLLTALPFSMIMRGHAEDPPGQQSGRRAGGARRELSMVDRVHGAGGPLGKSFETTIIGFAAVLDNISTMLDGEGRAAPIVWLGAAYLVLWLFLGGGILDRYARARPTRSHEFFTACGVYFVRFLRLAPIIALTYYALFAYLHPLLLSNLYGEITRNVTVERTAFLWRVALYLVFGAGLLAGQRRL